MWPRSVVVVSYDRFLKLHTFREGHDVRISLTLGVCAICGFLLYGFGCIGCADGVYFVVLYALNLKIIMINIFGMTIFVLSFGLV